MLFAILDPSRSQTEVLKALLRSEGHQAEVFRDAFALKEARQSRNFEFFIIDAGLEDASAVEVIADIRGGTDADAPLIVCGENVAEETVADLLHLGADDFVAKPIRYMEFMARVSVQLRRRRSAGQSPVQFGALDLDLEGRRIRLAGSEIDLTQREFDLAVVFLKNVGRVLPREELLSGVWSKGQEVVDSRTVDTHASRLRKKLGLSGESGLMLTSVYGQGYRLDTVQSN
jgi:DNA-binding response OmpR family regulator